MPAVTVSGVRRVLDAAEISPGGLVVDLGGGASALSLPALARVGPSGVVCAVDSASGGGGAPDGVRRVVAEAGRLPFADGAVQAVIGHTVQVDVAGVLGDAARVLAPEGKLSLGQPLPHYRRHDVLAGLTAAEQWRADTAILQAVPARLRHATDDLAAAIYPYGACLAVDSFAVVPETVILRDQDSVAEFLRMPLYPGVSRPMDMVRDQLGDVFAARYEAAWYVTLRQRRTIAVSTPTVFVGARRGLP
ncbi:hypothetical protein [Frankia sp. ACN1ag]|uniref:hypothetical protein n=1 Tax=Frankia sp. ACN1ag TaxID=102891 RepID=UPI0006DC8C72|nr:hypothetical protein [Frankia sp. ACN1ag]KQC37890.1 hypothetical protein UK82_12890 [Frankia sp. ACN1ag]